MSSLSSLAQVGGWTVVTFAPSPDVVAKLPPLCARFPAVRFVAVVPDSAAADVLPASPESAGVAVLVDPGGRLAARLGVGSTRSFIVDARGGIAHAWDGVPEAEAVAVYVARPPAPSGSPPWLFPVLATLVILAGLASWTYTHQPVPQGITTAAPAPIPSMVDEGVGSGEGEEEDAAVTEADPGAEGGAAAGEPLEGSAPAGKAAGAAKAKGGKRGAGGWVFIPKTANGTQAKVAGEVLTLTGGAAAVTACQTPLALPGPSAARLSWKASELSTAVRVTVRQLDAAGKPLKDKAAIQVLGKLKGTSDWAELSGAVVPVGAAKKARICMEMPAGSGSLQVKGATVGG